MQMDSTIINLTPHDINIKVTDDKMITIRPSGTVARCDTDFKEVDSVTSIINQTIYTFNIRERFFQQPYDLPEPREDTYFIVSRIVAEACANVRDDLLIVDGTIREKVDGRMVVVGCEGLARWPKINQGICDDGIVCLQNKEVYLNDVGRCGACQEQRDYEDDKFPKVE